MQQDLNDENTLFDIQIIGINDFSRGSGNALMTEGRDLPWLQDVDADGDEVSDVFLNLWPVRFRDVVIVDAGNVPLGTFNLTDYDLAETSNYEQLKAIFIDVASSPSVVAPPEADVNFDLIVDRADIVLLGKNFGHTSGVTRASGDLNNDSRVDLLDLAKLRRQMHQVAVSSAGQNVDVGCIIQAENFSHRNSTADFAWYLTDEVEAAGVGVFSGIGIEDGLYLQALDAHQSVTQPENPDTDGAYLEYGVTLTTPGLYGLGLRVAGFDGASDSLWVQIPTGTLQSSQGRPIDFGDAVRTRTGSDSSFAWQNAGLWTLDAGTHRIRLSMRESGVALDAIRLQRVANSPAAPASIIRSVSTIGSPDEVPADLSGRAIAVDRLFRRMGATDQEANMLSTSRRAARVATVVRDLNERSASAVVDRGPRRDDSRPRLRLTGRHRSTQRRLPWDVDADESIQSV